MKTQLFLPNMLLACISLCFFACGQDPEPPTPANSQEFSCKINGQPFTGAFFKGSLVSARNQFTGEWAKRFDIQAENQAKDTLVTLVFGLEPTADSVNACLPIEFDIEESELGPGASISSILVGGQFKGFPVSGYTRLSKCDETNLLVDGTFDNISTDLNTNEAIHFSEGKFKNISFTLIE